METPSVRLHFAMRQLCKWLSARIDQTEETMKKTFLSAIFLFAALLLGGCAPAANNTANGNAANKPANTGNTAAPAADAAAIETEIKKLVEDQRAAVAKNDTDALGKVWDEKYTFINPDGSVATKAQRLDAMKSGQTKIESLAYDEISVKSNAEGTGAIVIGRATVKGTNMGKPTDGQFRFTQVWSKTKDGWKSVSGQVTPITGAASSAPVANSASAANTAKSTSNANK